MQFCLFFKQIEIKRKESNKQTKKMKPNMFVIIFIVTGVLWSVVESFSMEEEKLLKKIEN